MPEDRGQETTIPLVNSAVSGAGLAQVDPVAAEQLTVQNNYLAITRASLPLVARTHCPEVERLAVY